MTQKEKQLLFKDLCARLPYGVKFPYHIEEDSNHRECECIATINAISEDAIEFTYDENGKLRDWSCIIKEVKPYLRPMSSMTEEEIDEYHKRCEFNDCDYTGEPMYFDTLESFDYLYSIHVDCRGLIPMGLALEAPDDMYKTK